MLKRDGRKQVRMRGSHRQFQHPSQPGTVTVAGRPGQDLPTGTLRSIIEQAGLRWTTAMKYAVVIEQSANGYGAWAPDLPGCVAAGKTRAETLRLMRETVELHLEMTRRQGEPMPPPTSTVDIVEVAA